MALGRSCCLADRGQSRCLAAPVWFGFLLLLIQRRRVEVLLGDLETGTWSARNLAVAVWSAVSCGVLEHWARTMDLFAPIFENVAIFEMPVPGYRVSGIRARVFHDVRLRRHLLWKRAPG